MIHHLTMPADFFETILTKTTYKKCMNTEYIYYPKVAVSKYKLMRRSFRWQLKWPQLPFANGLQIDSVMDPLKGAAALEEDGAKKEKKLSYHSWINETSEYHLSRTLSIRFLGEGKKSWTGKAIKSRRQQRLSTFPSFSCCSSPRQHPAAFLERFTLAITRLFYVPSGANEKPFASGKGNLRFPSD